MVLSDVLARLVSGLSYGSVYGLVAVSIVLLFRSNRLFNLAQTEIANLFVIVMFLLMRKVAYPAAAAITIGLSCVVGALLHFGIMRVITERKNVLHSNEVIVTLGFYSIFNSLSAYIFGDEPERFPSPFGSNILSAYGVQVSRHSLVILGATVLIAAAVYAFFKLTRLGLILEAISENVTAARLRGIHASNYLAIAWAITIPLAVIGGILLAPVLFLSPNMLVHVFTYALIAVVIGGLESPFGALIGGLAVGTTENLATLVPVFGSELKFAAVFLLLIAVLLVRPRGLWGREEQRRV